MLTEEFSQLTQIISNITKRVQTATERQKEISAKIETEIKEAENMIKNHAVAG